MEKKPTSGYDDTKRMLNTLRRLNESRTSLNVLSEQQQMDNNDILVINDVDVKLISTDSTDLKLMEDQKNSISTLIDSFRNEVSQIADLKPGLMINETQIRLDGSIPDMDINFVFIVGDEPGLYINADMLEINNEIIVQFGKLVKFEQTFKTSMEPMLRQRKTN
jgi:hypothetical protein